ncbi:hypothetical protein ACSSS7_001962 [Eimeria intestinalis]
MGGRNRFRRAQAAFPGSHSNMASSPSLSLVTRRDAREGRDHDDRLPSLTVRVDDSLERRGAHLQTQLTNENYPTPGFRPWASSQYQPHRYATRAQPRQRRQQQRARNRQQFPHPAEYYRQQRANEGQHYQTRETYQEHQQYLNQQIHENQHSYQAHGSYSEQGSCEVQHSYHEQLVICQQQHAHQGYPSDQTGQLHGPHQSYHTQQTYYEQQYYYAQDPAEPDNFYQSHQPLTGSRQLNFDADCNEAYGRSHRFSRKYNQSAKKRHHRHLHNGPARLVSKASTAATADGNGNELPWTWHKIQYVTNNKKYLEKHKGGEGLVFLNQAEAPSARPKPSPDELDIWVNVGTESPHVWGGKAADKPHYGTDDEEEVDGWAVELFGEEYPQPQAHSLRVIHRLYQM